MRRVCRNDLLPPRVPSLVRKALFLFFALALLSSLAFAHAGHQHHFLGTVKSLAADDLVVTATDGADRTFVLTDTTALQRGSEAASRADLTPGTRVSVEVANDGKTAVTIKLGAKK